MRKVLEPSILTSTKNILGLVEEYEAFDLAIATHINSVFSDLTQLGIGPVNGFQIEDKTAVWADFLGETIDLQYNSVRSYVFLKVKMLFDPPTTSYMISAMERQILELEVRLNIHREEVDWVNPDPPVPVEPYPYWG